MTDNRVDEPTGTQFVGHEWDGIEELDTPMPRWWLWALYISIAWGVVYMVLYPAWPMISQGTEGTLGWSSRGELAKDIENDGARKASLLKALSSVPIERLPEDTNLMRSAVAGGRAAFKVNCVQCHGAGAAGGNGYPNLNDDDWLWGGDLTTIEYTIAHGIRQPGHDQTRLSQMPAFGRDGILTPAQVGDIVSQVRVLSGKEAPSAASARGAQLFADNCAVCHGPEGKGLRQFGAPDLTDAISLFGTSRDAITQTVNNPRNGVMPAWHNRLDPVTIKMLAAYVHSLGGGENFGEVAVSPVEKVDGQP